MKESVTLKTNRASQAVVAASAGLIVFVLVGSMAQAEPLKPSGNYEEAKLDQNERPNVFTKTVRSVAQAPSEQVKTWVKEKFVSLQAFWGEKPKAPSAQPAPQPRAVVKSPLVTPSASPSSGSVPSMAAPTQPVPPAHESAREPAQAYIPPKPIGQGLPAPSARALDSRPNVAQQDLKGLNTSASGVAVYDLSSTEVIPRLSLPIEEVFKRSRYDLDPKSKSVMNKRIIHRMDSPDVLSESAMKSLVNMRAGQPGIAAQVRDVVFSPKGKVSRAPVDEIVMTLKPEAKLKLGNFKALSEEDIRFLSGLLLFQQGDKCAAAVGLFHKLSKNPQWQAEADYYLAMCSRKLGLETDFMERARRILETQDLYYAPKILTEVGYDVPYEFTDTLGLALFKASSSAKFMAALDQKTKDNAAFILAKFGGSTERFKTALTWAPKVPASHPRYLQARFVEALAEYQAGSKDKALQIQEQIIADKDADKARNEFQALVALNLARMYFQEEKFKDAQRSFLRVSKDHPLWLQSLSEMGWSQLQSGDFEGAIGNMYSIHSPFFASVYKPESFVIRTIGYLQICQYGDAYKTLSMMEHEYRPFLQKIDVYMKLGKKTQHYETVRNYLATKGSAKEVDGLPAHVIREMARHRDFTNLQKALNRQVDEKQVYAKFEAEIDKSLKRARWLVTGSRKRAEDLRKKIATVRTSPQEAKTRDIWVASLQNELEALNSHFFQVDLFNEAKEALPDYKKDVVDGADTRLASMKTEMEKILSNRLLRVKTDLARMLDNNELLRYEVFAGSGENIRYHVAGGEAGNRIPANIIPKSKSLQWDFDGEYWEDEIGHYRSSLKNNCPDAQPREHAQLDGSGQQ